MNSKLKIKGASPARVFLLFALSALASCGGGGGGGNSGGVSPPGPLSYPSPQVYTVAVPISALSPSVTGTVTSYSSSPALPPGLSLNETTGQITGTPTSPSAAANYEITASNSGGSSTFSLNITVTLPAPASLSYPSPETYTVGVAITTLNPTVKGAASSYSVAPSLPAGLALDSATGQISGTPTSVAASADYTITARNASGATSFSISIQVVEVPPSALSYPSPQTYRTGVPITPISPTVTGHVTSYAVSPSLPAGLSLDPNTGQISGTPTLPQSTNGYLISASNSGGQTTFTLTITVSLSAPSGLSYPTPIMFQVNAPIVPVTSTVQGIIASYSVVPALPPGVNLDPASGTISGTPTTAQGAAVYKITAQNAAGSASANVSIAIVTLTVSPGRISRLVAQGTPVSIAITLTPVDFSFSGTLYATATGTAAFSTPVTVGAPSGGTYPLTLTTSATANVGQYADNLVLNLCGDPACATPQPLRAISIPYNIHVLASNGPWPGNNLTALSAWPGVADWSMFQANAAHTGYVDVALDPNQFTTRWQGPLIGNGGLGGSNYPNNMTLTTSKGVFFVASGNLLYARNESDASVVWSYDLSGLQYPSTNPPSVANDIVYMAAGQQGSTYMFALNASDGSLVFKSPMSSQWEHYLAPTVGSSGVYTDAGTYGGLYGFQPSGTQLFFDATAMQDEWTPAVDASYVYAYTGNALYIVDPVTGAQHLQIADPTFTNYLYEIGGSVVLGAPGHAFAAAYENSLLNGCGIGNALLGFNTTAGTVDWEVPGCFPSTPAYHAGLLYVANQTPLRLEVRSEADGSLQWSWTPPLAGDTNFESEVLLTRNMAFVSTNNAVYGIDTTTHKAVWSYPTNGGARLAISANGVLYLQNGGPLTAINVK